MRAWRAARGVQCSRQCDAFQRFKYAGGWQQWVCQCTRISGSAKLSGVVSPRCVRCNKHGWGMIECLEPDLIKVCFGLYCRTQHCTGLAAVRCRLVRRNPERQQRHCNLLPAHDMPLAANQGFKLLTQFCKRLVLEPPLPRFDQRSGQETTVDIDGQDGVAHCRPRSRSRQGVVQSGNTRERPLRGGHRPPSGAASSCAASSLTLTAPSASSSALCAVRLVRSGRRRASSLAVRRISFWIFVAHAAQVAKTDAVDGRQFARIVDAHPVEHVLTFEAVAELRHGGQRRGGLGVAARLVSLPGSAGCTVYRAEDGTPRSQHVFGIVKTFAVVPPQGLGEEGCELFTGYGIENIAFDAGFDIEHGRRRLPVAPDRWLSSGHLVQGDRCCEPLRVQIPTAAACAATKGSR